MPMGPAAQQYLLVATYLGTSTCVYSCSTGRYYYEGTILLDIRGKHKRGANSRSNGQGIAEQLDTPSSLEAYASREP